MFSKLSLFNTKQSYNLLKTKADIGQQDNPNDQSVGKEDLELFLDLVKWAVEQLKSANVLTIEQAGKLQTNALANFHIACSVDKPEDLTPENLKSIDKSFKFEISEVSGLDTSKASYQVIFHSDAGSEYGKHSVNLGHAIIGHDSAQK